MTEPSYFVAVQQIWCQG